MTTFNLWCPYCRKVTTHKVFPDDKIPITDNRRVWMLRCDCGIVYKCISGFKFDDQVKASILHARERSKMFWTDDERKLCPEEQTKAEIARLHDKHKIGDKEIERIVRDAIILYAELYQIAPNDCCERELKERAAIANKWLNDHGFVEEKVAFDEEELT